MNKQATRESIIMQALGRASMCWSETPTGVFDSERARQIGEDIKNYLVYDLIPEWYQP